jgi:hypothetical protein
VEWLRGEQVIAQEQVKKHGEWLVYIHLFFMEKHGGQRIKIYLTANNNEL